jgi:hypothetical protein
MDAIKLLAAVVFALGDADSQVVLTVDDVKAAVVMDKTNLIVTPSADGGLVLKAVSQSEALAEQRAQQIRRGV